MEIWDAISSASFVVLFTIPILAFWLVSVNYQHWSVVGIWLVLLTTFCCLAEIWRELRLWTIWRELQYSSKRGPAMMHQKGGRCPPFEWKRGSRQIYNTKMYQPSFYLVSVGKIPKKYQPIPTNNTKSVNNSIVLGYKLFNCLMYQVPVPTLFG